MESTTKRPVGAGTELRFKRLGHVNDMLQNGYDRKEYIDVLYEELPQFMVSNGVIRLTINKSALDEDKDTFYEDLSDYLEWYKQEHRDRVSYILRSLMMYIIVGSSSSVIDIKEDRSINFIISTK